MPSRGSVEFFDQDAWDAVVEQERTERNRLRDWAFAALKTPWPSPGEPV